MEINKHRTTEEVSKKTKDLDTYNVKEIIGFMNEEDKTVAESVERSLPQIEKVIQSVIGAISKGGKLYYIGAGTSGRLGVLDASECPPTFGVDPDLVVGLIAGGEEAFRLPIEDAEDNREAGREDVTKKVTANDAVIGIAASGTTPYVLAGIEAANDIGAVTAGISCNEDTPLSNVAQMAIELLCGSEILSGSTRLKAGTAQKMVLNMISTATMIKLGKVYGNLMVNMQATNQKLRKRAVEIVEAAADVSHDKAINMIDKANGDTRAAILMMKYDTTYEYALKALNQANDHFRDAMDIIEKDKK